jgi:DNA-binding PadR family transcriptional regulator
VSPIFRHGRLRLYLLKLLDEAPRHGYEVIRLLQDRFMGVYSPSPGTIYPRLARLEEDGLVTHDEVDGRKVYRITDKGREEIQARLDDLAELEEELTESVRDIAREVSEDVRDTVRSLREEITWAARDFRREGGRRPSEEPEDTDKQNEADRRDERPGADQRAADEPAADERGRVRADDDTRIRDEARRVREEIRDSFRTQRRGRPGRDQDESGAGAGRGLGDDWGGWADRAAGWQSWSDRRGSGGKPGGARPGGGPASGGRPGGGRPGGGWGGWQDLAGGMPAGLERLASDFARELRSAAGHAEDIREGALGDLRDILADTLARIRDEVFTGDPGTGGESDDSPADDETPKPPTE